MGIASSRRWIALGLAASSALASSGAHAQIWIGQIVGNMMAQQAAYEQEARCMSGTAMPDSEVAETRATALAAMAGYWQAVRSGAPSDVARFYYPQAKVGWTSGPTRLGATGLTKVSDPLALAGATIDAEPNGYVRSGDGRTVRGQWRVRRADGGLAGTYDAQFRRSGSTWLLVDLTLLGAKDYAEPVVQFCHKPNDVLPYRLASSQTMRDYATKRADKMAAKALKARADADKATAKGTDTAAEARLRADDAEKKAALAATGLRAAIEANDKAKADAAAADAARARAIAELAAS